MFTKKTGNASDAAQIKQLQEERDAAIQLSDRLATMIEQQAMEFEQKLSAEKNRAAPHDKHARQVKGKVKDVSEEDQSVYSHQEEMAQMIKEIDELRAIIKEQQQSIERIEADNLAATEVAERFGHEKGQLQEWIRQYQAADAERLETLKSQIQKEQSRVADEIENERVIMKAASEREAILKQELTITQSKLKTAEDTIAEMSVNTIRSQVDPTNTTEMNKEIHSGVVSEQISSSDLTEINNKLSRSLEQIEQLKSKLIVCKSQNELQSKEMVANIERDTKLLHEITTLKAILHETEQRNSDLEHQTVKRSDFEQQKHAAIALEQSLKNELDQTNNRLQQNIVQLEQTRSERDEIVNDMRSQTEQLASAREREDKLRSELSHLEKKLQIHVDEEGEYKVKMADARNTIETQSQQLQEAIEHEDRMRVNLNELEQSLADMKMTLQEEQRLRMEEKTNLNKITTSITQIHEQRDDLQKQSEIDRENLIHCQERDQGQIQTIAALELAVKGLNDEIATLNANHQTKIEEFTEERNRYLVEKNELHRLWLIKEQDLGTKSDRLKVELDQALEQISTHEIFRMEQESNRDTLNEQIVSLQKDISRSEGTISILTGERDEFNRQHNELQQITASVRSSEESLKQDLAKQKTIVKNFEERIVDQDRKLNAITEEADKAKEKIEKSHINISDLQKEVVEQTGKIADLTAKRNKYQEKVDNLSVANEAMAIEVERLKFEMTLGEDKLKEQRYEYETQQVAIESGFAQRQQELGKTLKSTQAQLQEALTALQEMQAKNRESSAKIHELINEKYEITRKMTDLQESVHRYAEAEAQRLHDGELMERRETNALLESGNGAAGGKGKSWPTRFRKIMPCCAPEEREFSVFASDHDRDRTY